MSTIDASALLRPGVLQGVSLILARAQDSAAPVGAAVAAGCAALGAHVIECPIDPHESSELAEARVAELLDGAPGGGRGVVLLAVDAASLFGSGSPDRSEVSRESLRRCLDESWSLTRTLAERVFLPGGVGGRVVYIAPAPDAGEHADAARAGLENLARTLSIEWARYSITVVTIALGCGEDGDEASVAREAAALTAYLACPAGAYFSGCLLDLRGPSPL
jgi:NAD(P)-dependent dehydrogenase (short-subunit alcohol dehydrogenase family)